MKQSAKVLIWAAAVVFVLGGAYIVYRLLGKNYAQNQSSQIVSISNSQATSPAPDFTVYDDGGNKVTLSSKFGKPIVLNFWASWCGPCKEELPDFDKVCAELGAKVEFFMVNVDSPGTEADVKAFLAENGYDFPVYYDTDYDGVTAYNVSGIPISYFIDADGEIAVTQRGTISEKTLRDGITQITD